MPKQAVCIYTQYGKVKRKREREYNCHIQRRKNIQSKEKCEIKWGADRKVIADWKEDDVV